MIHIGIGSHHGKIKNAWRLAPMFMWRISQLLLVYMYSGIEEEEDMGHQFLNRVVLAVCPDSSFAMFIPSPL